ncbi:4-alpha-glucanotransferase [Mycobacterium manitobense]|uniref:4-alpha-glucanotransferase n=1 Tax=[Mycobacterium] manitobense TaxID=190147 RepID=A0A9X3BWL3_9MYCO|nr:4-alpha-glucanotransferase [[Mycobacterium] manitobense]MCV7172863.1 4-alpha-glucanotransferase [[Mycobacterium] manitobense]
MTELPASLVELAGRYGVATRFEDWTGRQVTVAESTLTAVLAALGVAADTEDDRAAALAGHEREYWQRPLPPIVLARSGAVSSFWVHVTHGEPVEVSLRLEDGTERTGLRQLENNRDPYEVDGRRIGEASFEVPDDLPLGYHRVLMHSGATHADTPLVVSPSTLALPARLGARRSWGLATQLYSVRSRNSWGIGDLTDLADLAVWSAARHQAGFILVNPLHAAAPAPPMEPSPYLPTSRRYVNPVYLRVEAIPEFAYVRGRNRIRKARAGVQDKADRAELIDRDTVWRAKRAALAKVYEVPWSAGRQLAYEAYCTREGASLDAFATWCALAERHGNDWHQWPEEFRRPDSAAVAQFARDHAATVDFHRWLQFALDEQLTVAQATALQAGMDLGIMTDLAVGVDPNGADAWALQDVLALGVTAGAPPDEFNQLGQDWSQPPWRPDELVAQAYEPFRALVNAVLRHAGGVRIDHIIGLFRLWWIPRGAPPTEGTYVRYDHEAMIGIVALEAHRAGAVVVGEDLGTVEPWVRDYLGERGVFGTSILWFELDRDSNGGQERSESGNDNGQSPPGPLPAERWRECCLSSVTTHDLPPTAGYLAGEHVRLREELGLLTRPAAEELADDRAQQAAWRAELRRVGLLDEDAGVEETVLALHRYLGRTPSKLLALSLVDAVGDVRTQNQPGTSDEYPNWQIPLSGPDGRPVLLEDVFTDSRAARLAEAMAQQVNPPL